jgi:hypothetical protein
MDRAVGQNTIRNTQKGKPEQRKAPPKIGVKN